MNKRVIGSSYEDLACNYIKEQGGKIVERNFRCKLGEIDIIARDGPYLCFIEVKFRKDESFGDPSEAVNYSKRRRISNVSRFYLYSKKISFDSPIRYDVIAVCASKDMLTFNWLKNAFDFC